MDRRDTIKEASTDFYDELKLYVPTYHDDSMNSALREVDQIRYQLISIERRIVALSSYNLKPYPSFIPPKKKLAKFIFNRNPLSSKEATPAFIQHAGLMIPFIHSNADKFALAVCKMSAQKEFNFLISSAVPAFYGFFSSMEHVEQAAPFYLNVVRIASPKLAAKIIEPFFASICTFRFIESVMNRFIVKFGARIKLLSQASKSKIGSQLSTDLMFFIVSAMKLLPPPYLSILNIIKAKEWKDEEKSYFFFTRFFIPQSIAWMKSSPFELHVSAYEKILKETEGNAAHFIFESTDTSLFDIPYLYFPYGQNYMLYLMSAADVMIVAKTCMSDNVLPPALQEVNYDDFPSDIKYAPFWVRVFPRSLKRPKPKLTRIVYPRICLNPLLENAEFDKMYRLIENSAREECVNPYDILETERFAELTHGHDKLHEYVLHKTVLELSNRTNEFETMIFYRLHLSFLKQWFDLAEKHEFVHVAPFAKEYAKKIRKSSSSAKDAYYKANTPFTKSIRRFIFLYLHETVIQSRLDDFMSHFQSLTKKWNNLLQAEKQNPSSKSIAVSTLPKPAQIGFWEVSEQLTSLSMTRIRHMFYIINEVFRKVSVFNPKLTALLNLSISANCPELLQFFLLIHHIVMKDSEFLKLITENDYQLWTQAESFFLILIFNSQDPEFPQNYLVIQDKLNH